MKPISSSPTQLVPAASRLLALWYGTADLAQAGELEGMAGKHVLRIWGGKDWVICDLVPSTQRLDCVMVSLAGSYSADQPVLLAVDQLVYLEDGRVIAARDLQPGEVLAAGMTRRALYMLMERHGESRYAVDVCMTLHADIHDLPLTVVAVREVVDQAAVQVVPLEQSSPEPFLTMGGTVMARPAVQASTIVLDLPRSSFPRPA